MASFASSATTGGARKHVWTKNQLPVKLVKSNAWKERRREKDEVEDIQGLGLIQADCRLIADPEAIPTDVMMNSTPFSSIKTEKVKKCIFLLPLIL